MPATDPSWAQSGFEESADHEFDVFLAYNSKDEDARTRVMAISDVLERRKKKAWIDTLDSVAGEASTEVMLNGLKASRCCIMFHGSAGLGRWQEDYELQTAIGERVRRRGEFRVFAVLLPGSRPNAQLPGGLENWTIRDLSKAFTDQGLTEDGLDELLAAVEGVSLRDFRKRREAAPTTGAVPTAAGTSRYRALIVGVASYSKLPDLQAPLDDVRQVSKALADAGAPGSPGWDVTSRNDPDHDELMYVLGTLFPRDGPKEETLLFYYSGHGLVAGDSYISAKDTDPLTPAINGVAASLIVQLVNNSPAEEKVLILDCCHGSSIKESAFESLSGNVAVVLASQGLAADASNADELSPFTQSLVHAIRSPKEYDESGLTVERIVNAVRRESEHTWWNRRGGDVRVTARAPGSSPFVAPQAPPSVTFEITTASLSPDRLPLIRQLATTVDGLLTMAQDEPHYPGRVVQDSVRMLADELRHLLTESQLEQLDATLKATTPQTCLVGFKDRDARELLGELPWEFLALESESASKIALERAFRASAMKGDPALSVVVQSVVLFNSLLPLVQGEAHPVLTATETDLRDFLSAVTVWDHASWNTLAAGDEEDVVVLQAPVRLGEKGEPEMLFVRKDTLRGVPAESLASRLKARSRLTRILIETIADESRGMPGLALRRLAGYLARELGRPVVAICHPREYYNTLVENNDGRSGFVVKFLQQLHAGVSPGQAARIARNDLVQMLAVDPALIGIPIVMTPVQPPERPQRGRPSVPGPSAG